MASPCGPVTVIGWRFAYSFHKTAVTPIITSSIISLNLFTSFYLYFLRSLLYYIISLDRLCYLICTMSDLDRHSSSSAPQNTSADPAVNQYPQRAVAPAIAAVPETMMTRSGKIVSRAPGRSRGILSLLGRRRGEAVSSSPGHGRKRKRTLNRGESSAAGASDAVSCYPMVG